MSAKSGASPQVPANARESSLEPHACASTRRGARRKNGHTLAARARIGCNEIKALGRVAVDRRRERFRHTHALRLDTVTKRSYADGEIHGTRGAPRFVSGRSLSISPPRPGRVLILSPPARHASRRPRATSVSLRRVGSSRAARCARTEPRSLVTGERRRNIFIGTPRPAGSQPRDGLQRARIAQIFRATAVRMDGHGST